MVLKHTGQVHDLAGRDRGPVPYRRLDRFPTIDQGHISNIRRDFGRGAIDRARGVASEPPSWRQGEREYVWWLSNPGGNEALCHDNGRQRDIGGAPRA